jgi:hypothetical protein
VGGVRNVRGEDLESETQRERELYYVLCTAGVWGVDKKTGSSDVIIDPSRTFAHLGRGMGGVEGGRGEGGYLGEERQG